MNRTVFFDRVRTKPFGGSLTQKQVDGLGAILDAATKYGVTDVRHLAYCLATAYHETAHTMQPIREKGSGDGPDADPWDDYLEKYDTGKLAKALGNTPEADGDGVKFAGRGYVQLTGRANYERAGKEVGANLLASPDLALDPGIAAAIMFRGMLGGWFTGRKLVHYFSAQIDDPVNARKIINGTDKAATIAGYHRDFLAALKAAGWGAAPVAGDKPAEPVPVVEPAPAPIAPATATSGWAALIAFILGIIKRSAK